MLRSPIARWTARGLSLLCALAAGASCHPRSGDAEAGLQLKPCRPKGITEEVRCGTLPVFEDRAGRSGKRIELHVAVVPALSPSPEPDPVFVLAGGPGQAASEHISDVLTILERVHRKRDLVFVDQRGTGQSNPLACDTTRDAGIVQQFQASLDTRTLRRCLETYERSGSHPGLYTTPLAVDDLDDVRRALGYDSVNLWGVSYGTRAGLVYLRRHGEHVRTAILDGVAPTTLSLLLSSAEDAERALSLIFRDCNADASCRRAYPDLQGRFRGLLEALDKSPVHIHVQHPLTGEPVALTLTRASFVTNLHGLLYAPEISTLLPLIIDRASRGDFQPFVTQALGLTGGMAGDISFGMLLSVLCAEDFPAATPEARAAHTRGTSMGDALSRDLAEACGFWPRGAVPEGYHSPVHSDAPVLLLSGELDPVTPPQHAQEVLAALPRARAVVVPGVGHGVSPQGCVPRLIAQFIDSGGAGPIDSGCVLSNERPPFFVDFAGPPP